MKQTLWHCHPTPVSCLDPPQTFPFVHPLLLIPAVKLQSKSPLFLIRPFLSTLLVTALLGSGEDLVFLCPDTGELLPFFTSPPTEELYLP